MWGFPGSSEVKNLPANAGDVSSVRSRSCVQLFATPWTTAHQAYLSITNSRSLLKITSIKLVMPSNHLILCCPLLLLPSIFPSIRVFSSELALCIRWPKYWSFSFNISLSSYPSDATWFLWDKGSEGFPGGASGKETASQCRRGKRVQSLSRENPQEEGMAIHSSVLAWRIPWTEEPGGLQSMGSQRVDTTEAT